MSNSIKIEDLAKTVQDELDKYLDVTYDQMSEAVKDAGKTVVKEISAGASEKFKGEKYANSWVAKETGRTTRSVTVTVHSPSQYRIAHLLEKGHAKRGGGRVEGRPHIEPAERKGKEQLEEDLRKALEG